MLVDGRWYSPLGRLSRNRVSPHSQPLVRGSCLTDDVLDKLRGWDLGRVGHCHGPALKQGVHGKSSVSSEGRQSE